MTDGLVSPKEWKWSKSEARSGSLRSNVSVILALNASYLLSSGGLLMKLFNRDAVTWSKADNT